MPVKDSILIVYPPGGYGTYLEWCLSSATKKIGLFSPFNSNGNSHKYNLYQHHNNDVSDYVNSDIQFDFVRTHPKTSQDVSMPVVMDEYCQNFRKVINLYPSKHHVLLCVNNYFDKVWKDWWSAQFTGYKELLPQVDTNKIYDNWAVDPGVPINEIPVWIRREFLSFYLMPSWYDMVDWYFPEKWQNTNAIHVTTDELLYQYKSTLSNIIEFCNITTDFDLNLLIPYHNQNISLQKNLSQDWLCEEILNSTLEQREFDWKNQRLPLPSQAWIQMKLREHGLEIQCDGLDNFPTNSVMLEKLLYRS